MSTSRGELEMRTAHDQGGDEEQFRQLQSELDAIRRDKASVEQEIQGCDRRINELNAQIRQERQVQARQQSNPQPATPHQALFKAVKKEGGNRLGQWARNKVRENIPGV